MPGRRRFHADGWGPLEGRSLPSTAAPLAGPSTVLSVPRTENYVKARLAAILREADRGTAQIVLLGDSLTDFWTTQGAASWAAVMAPRGAVDFGIYGNSTGTLRAQIAAGELKGRPKVVVLMIGTNNILRGDSPVQVAQGIAANIAAIRSASPKSQIVLMSVLPVLNSNAVQTMKVSFVNALISQFDDGKRVHFLNIHNDYLLPNGTQNRALFADVNHLSALGYSLWARRISGVLDILTGRAAPPPSKPVTPPPAPPPT